MVNLGEAYKKLIGKTVRAAQADKQLTKKRRRKDEQKTNKQRTKNEQKTVRAARADGERTNK